MRVVLDTNILVSALLVQLGHAAAIYRAWYDGHYAPDLRGADRRTEGHAAQARAGRLINALKELAETIGPLPRVERSPYPTGYFLLALSEAGKADYLVTGDKSGLLSRARHQGTRIISASDFTRLRSSGS